MPRPRRVVGVFDYCAVARIATVFVAAGFLAACGAAEEEEDEPVSATLAFDAASYDFGTRHLVSATNAPITITNSGTGTATQIQFATPASPFAFAGGSPPGTGGTCTSSLAAGESCTIVLTYTAPAVLGDSQKAFQLTYFDGAVFRAAVLVLNGSADNLTFNPARGFNAAANAMANVGTSLVVGGTFEGFDRMSRGVARFSGLGTFDTAFSTGLGFQTTTTVHAIAAAPDVTDAFYVGGDFTTINGSTRNRLVRVLGTGAVDTSFDVLTGISGGAVQAVAAAADGTGDVYAGGAFTAYDVTGINRAVRINSDGSIDAAFNVGTGFNSTVYAILPQADGNVYVAGDFTTYNGGGQVRIVRLTNLGAVDGAFVVGAGFTGGAVNVLATSADTAGLYVGGAFTQYKGAGAVGITRLDSVGTVDPAFVTGTGFTGGAVTEIQPLNDGTGKIYVGGAFTAYNGTAANRIIRLDSTGAVDTTFAYGTGFDAAVGALGIFGGKLVVAGTFVNYQTSITVNRIVELNSDGSVGTGFAQGAGIPSASGQVNGVAVASDSSATVYVAGTFNSFNGTSFGKIVRLKVDGTIDTAFNSTAGFNNNLLAVAPGPNGTVYAGGSNVASYAGTSIVNFIRLTTSGAIDTTFATTGCSPGANGVSAIAMARDGSNKVYAGGSFTSCNGTASSRIARFNTDGSLDTSFALGTGFDGNVAALAPHTDGDVYVLGAFANYNGTGAARRARRNSDGRLDTFFGVGTGPSSGTSGAVAISSDAKLFVGGGFTTYNGAGAVRIARVNTDGTLDTTFVTGTGWTGATGVRMLVADGAGGVYAGGGTTAYNGTTIANFVKLDSLGAIDTTFAMGTGFSTTVLAGAAATDGSHDIYIGGLFTNYNGITTDKIVRLSTTGSSD